MTRALALSLVVHLLLLAGCAGQTTASTTRALLDAHARCEANLALIGRTAPSRAEGERMIEAEVARCEAQYRCLEDHAPEDCR